MPWSLAILGFFVHIDAERDPWAAIGAAAVASWLLWLIVVQARRREERKAEADRTAADPRTRNW
jgi:hypothetical protein